MAHHCLVVLIDQGQAVHDDASVRFGFRALFFDPFDCESQPIPGTYRFLEPNLIVSE